MEEKIRVKIRLVEEYKEKLLQILPDTFDEYQKNLVIRLAIERLLQLAIESAIDICAILVRDLHLGPPQNEDHILDLLQEKLPNISVLKAMKRFRNILLHRYEIVNDQLVYQYATEQSSDFDQFVTSVKSLLKTLKKK